MALLWILAAATIVHVVLDNRQPAKTMAWILVILFVPLVGVVLYFFFGVSHRKERLISQRSLDQLTKRSMLGFVEQPNLSVPEEHKRLVDLFVNQNLALPFRLDGTEFLSDGYSFFSQLLQDIGRARSHIHIEMYIIEDDPLGRLVADVLADKVRQGVEVRLIYDDVGCWRVGRRFFEQLRERGVEVGVCLPVRFPSFTSKANYRNHRKLVVIDGEVGYIGGMNVALRYVKGIRIGGKEKGDTGLLPWRDLMVRMTGIAVYAMQRAFLVDWYFVDRTLITDRRYYPPTPIPHHPSPVTPLAQIVTSGPMARYPEIMQGYVHAIMAARRYVYIETPYFMPNDPVLFALKTAALAGVDVRLMIPQKSDTILPHLGTLSYLRDVLQAGVKVYRYKKGFLHSKLMVSDDALVSVGSTNMDFRSFEHNFEVNAFVCDKQLASDMKRVFIQDQADSEQVSLKEWKKRPWWERLIEGTVRLMAPLL